jgi:hypothetical protein
VARNGLPVRAIDPHRLDEHTWTLDGRSCHLDRQPLGALLIHARPYGLSASGFVPEDAPFAAAELSATLLAASQLPDVLAINRLDAEAWFEDACPGLLVRRAAGGRACPMSYGAWPRGADVAWRPYRALQERRPPADVAARAMGAMLAPRGALDRGWYAVCGRPLEPAAPRSVDRLARSLWSEGIGLAKLYVDRRGRLGGLDVCPPIEERTAADPAAARIAEAIVAHLRDR